MSWFKRRPKVKEPASTPPKATSPMTIKQLKKVKRAVREDDGTTVKAHVPSVAARK